MEVLVVDDEPQLSEIMAEYLSRCGYQVTCAQNGGESLELIRAQHFSVVISDITMPGISGLELLKSIREISPETSVILMTGSASAQAAKEALEKGAFAVLQKPFSLQELKEKVDQAARFRSMGPPKEVMRGSKNPDHGEQNSSSSLRSKELQVLASMGAALALADKQGIVLDVNDGFCRTFSKKDVQVRGNSLCKALGCALSSESACSNPCEMWDRFQRVVRQKHSSGPFICSIPLQGRGTRQHFIFHTRVLMLPQGNGSGAGQERVAVLMEDISEFLDAEAQVLDPGCLGCLGEITRDIVHELAQPLNAISAQCQLLKFRIEQQGESSKEVVLSSLAELQRQTSRMTEVLNHLRSGYRNRSLVGPQEPNQGSSVQ